MADFKRIKTIGQFPEHQEGYVAHGWEIVEESSEFWTAEKDAPRPSLKAGESSMMSVLFSKEEWKRIQ